MRKLKGLYFYANNYPYSSYASKRGIIDAISTSKTLKFNKDKFLSNANEKKAISLCCFDNKEDAILKANKFKRILKYRDSDIVVANTDYIPNCKIVIQSYYGTFELLIVTNMITRFRSIDIDERSHLLSASCDASCAVCGVDGISENRWNEKSFTNGRVFIFGDNNIRPEFICSDCSSKNNIDSRSKYHDESTLINIIKAIKKG